MTGGINPSEGARFEKILFLWVDIVINNYIIRYLSKTLGKIAGATAKAIANQENSLNSFALLVLDNKIALDHTLAEQNGVCSVGNTSCCT